MDPKADRVGELAQLEAGKHRREQHAYRCRRQYQRLQSLQAHQPALDPVDRDGEPHHDRERVAEAKPHRPLAEKVIGERDGMQRERHENRQTKPSRAG